MNDYFLGSISQLIERGRLLLLKIRTDLPREFHLLAQTCRTELTKAIDQLQYLVNEDRMQLLELQPERLRLLRRIVRTMDLLETVGIAALNRANESDKQLNLLIECIRNEIAYPLLPPVVTSLSQDYFHIYPGLNLLCVPLGEGDFLLHLPDLYHELAHPLIVEKYDPRVKPFQDNLLKSLAGALSYITDELGKEERRRGPSQFGFYLNQWANNWYESWAFEFFCDLFAVYTVGSAFAWANFHLCAKRGGNPFYVPTVSLSTHPADDARMRVVLYGLELVGLSQEAEVIGKKWRKLIDIGGEKPEPEYWRCFPQHILEEFAKNALEGVSAIGCRMAGPVSDCPVYVILNQAWTEFWRDPINYAAWEQEAVKELRQVCAPK